MTIGYSYHTKGSEKQHACSNTFRNSEKWSARKVALPYSPFEYTVRRSNLFAPTYYSTGVESNNII